MAEALDVADAAPHRMALSLFPAPTGRDIEDVDFSEFHVLVRRTPSRCSAKINGGSTGRMRQQSLAIRPILRTSAGGRYWMTNTFSAWVRRPLPNGSWMQSLTDTRRCSEVPEPLQAYLQNVADHVAHASVRVSELRDALSQILSVNSTLVAQRQNEDMKKISGWAAILFEPTLIGAIYGMNFDNMPELHWAFGYPLALGSMVAFGLVLYAVFRFKKWM
ncbi:CorA family divalent cation transporter [Arthrobacter sp. 35W]|uniref:CorA family divalent cation transporter n=1 Tax=Arthrobacter sp. 35W TaxID=1132441 RepID=UPI00047BB8DC